VAGMNPVQDDRLARSTKLLPLRPGEPALAVFAAVCLGIATTVSLMTRGYEFLFYIAVMVLVMWVVVHVHRRVGLSLASLWALNIWGAAHMAGGMLPLPAPTGVLYNLWLIGHLDGHGIKYDQLVHAYGFGITAWVCWQCLRARLAVPTPTLGMAVLCTLSGMGLGALNEVVEFAATKLVEKTNVGDYDNNMWDLTFNMIGAVVAGATIWTRGRRDRSGSPVLHSSDAAAGHVPVSSSA